MKTNPIDKDKIAENPHLLPYAHTLGSAIIRPYDEGKIKGLALKSMYKQTDTQLKQLKEQLDLLVSQAQKIHDRIAISESIYTAECKFKPNVGSIYYLYETKNATRLLSMIAPEEWGNSSPYTHIASVELLGDHTWEVLS